MTFVVTFVMIWCLWKATPLSTNRVESPWLLLDLRFVQIGQSKVEFHHFRLLKHHKKVAIHQADKNKLKATEKDCCDI